MNHEWQDSEGNIVNWSRFWAQERDIYIRNLTETNISLTIGTGREAYYVSIPVSADPMNLTAEASFEDLKKSQDFRKICAARDKRNRPLIQVMEEDEYRRHFEDRAHAMKVTADEAMRRAEQARALFRQRVKEVPEPVQQVIEPEAAFNQLTTESDLVRDRIRVLMHQVHQDTLDEQSSSQLEGRAFNPTNVKTTASKILETLTGMRDLTADELEHVLARGYWPSVKRWATMGIQKLREIPTAEEIPIVADDGDAFIQRQGMAG